MNKPVWFGLETGIWGNVLSYTGCLQLGWMGMQSLSYTRFKPGAVTGVADALHFFLPDCRLMGS